MKKSIALLVASTLSFAVPALAQDAPAPGYMIATYDIKDEAGFQQYMEAAGPLAPRFNGRIIIFDLHAKAIEGQARSVMAIAQFPSLADAQRFYNSPEYTAARKLRIASTQGTVVITEGFTPPKP